MADSPIRALPTDGLDGSIAWIREQLDSGNAVGLFQVVFTKEGGFIYTTRGDLRAKDMFWVHELIDTILRDSRGG